VHLNGQVVRSCILPVGSVKAADKIVTIEGLSANRSHAAAEGLGGARCAAVRLLPVGRSWRRRRSWRGSRDATDRDIDDCHDQHLPVRDAINASARRCTRPLEAGMT